jgi:predicted ATP-dependent Lon-type protease
LEETTIFLHFDNENNSKENINKIKKILSGLLKILFVSYTLKHKYNLIKITNIHRNNYFILLKSSFAP